MHRLLKAGSVDNEPTPNARAFVTEVIVIEGPAWVKPYLKRLIALLPMWSGVWSIVLTITNISSTPIPIIMNGMIAWNLVVFHPRARAIPYPEVIDRRMQVIPTKAVADRK